MKVERIKQDFVDLKNLMWPFKWYILANIIIPLMVVREYFFPPEADDPIWGAQATMGAWNYANQELYMESAKFGIVIGILVFLLGTSNMRNHPRIAKLIFLSPWLFGVMHLLLVLLGIESD